MRDIFTVQYRRDANETWQCSNVMFSTMDQAKQWATSQQSGLYYQDGTQAREWRVLRFAAEVVE